MFPYQRVEEVNPPTDSTNAAAEVYFQLDSKYAR